MRTRMLKAERMAALVEAAVGEFLENGYEGASMDRIARRAEVTKGGLYHHFPGKDALFLFAAQRLGEPAARLLAEAEADPEPLRGLERYVGRYLTFWAKRPRQTEFLLLAMTKLGQLPAARRAYADAYGQTCAVLASMYRRASETGALRPVPAEAAALALASALDGALGLMLVDPGRSAAATATALRRILLDVHRAERPAPSRRRAP